MSASAAILDVHAARAAARRSSVRPGLLLVANANASGLRAGRETIEAARRALRRFGADVDVHLTVSPEELAALFGEVDGERRVVLLGGDGTLHAAANLQPAGWEVALLPAGRANNIARSLGIPTDLAAAAQIAVGGRVSPLDLIAASSSTGRYLAVEGVSAGFLAQARARYRSPNSADLAAGVAAGVGALARFHPLSVAIDSDGAAEVTRIGQLFVANLPLYGFSLRVAPDADPADGLLDLVTISAPNRRSVVPMLARLRRGTHVGRPDVRIWRARRVRIATGGSSPVIADSTNLGPGPVDLEVVRAALNVVVPAR